MAKKINDILEEEKIFFERLKNDHWTNGEAIILFKVALVILGATPVE